jgi:peptidoglycan/xylan/chitin deacetylase (PgdA/CDA1 family)
VALACYILTMGPRPHLAALLIAGLVCLAGPADAGWPTPAAGHSVSGGPEIIFTFDDGPSPVTTPKVLDILAQHHIAAVFFMVGEMAASGNKKVPGIIARILREGHVIANHTMTHADLCRGKQVEKAAAEIDDGRDAIERASGITIGWFRTPYGSHCKRVEQLLAERHLTHFHWDIDPQEWKHGDVKRTVTYVTRELGRLQGRGVLLMHDIKPVTVKALPQILDWLDAENARRVGAGAPPIRVIGAPALARERLPTGLVDVLDDATAGLGHLGGQLATALP